MKFLEKLASKKGQVSMEIGILAAAAVAVAAIAAYYYAKNVKSSGERTQGVANSTIDAMNVTANYSLKQI